MKDVKELSRGEAMTLKEFETLLKEDPILLQKFKEAKEAVSGEDAKNKGTALCGIIQNLGYDVSAEEITLGLIGEHSFDENELEAVAGGVFSGGCGGLEKDIEEKKRLKKAWIKATIRNTSQ